MNRRALNNLKNWQCTMESDINARRSTPYMNDHTASSRQLAAHCSTATDVLMSGSSIQLRRLLRGQRARMPIYRIPLPANQFMCLHWAHENKIWQDVWYQVVFSDESRFNLWDEDDNIRIRLYAVNTALQKLSNYKASDHLELFSGVRFYIICYPVCYESKVI